MNNPENNPANNPAHLLAGPYAPECRGPFDTPSGDDVQHVRIPAWFGVMVHDVITRFHALGLEGRPAQDTLDTVADSWAQTLWDARGGNWDPADEGLMVRAVNGLSGELRKWPAPVVLIERFRRIQDERRPARPLDPSRQLPAQGTLDEVQLRNRIRSDAARLKSAGGSGKFQSMLEALLDRRFDDVQALAGELAKEKRKEPEAEKPVEKEEAENHGS